MDDDLTCFKIDTSHLAQFLADQDEEIIYNFICELEEACGNQFLRGRLCDHFKRLLKEI